MVRPPNPVNGGLLREMANKYNLTDPFRIMYPEKIAFSYNPFGPLRKNRSRIDFFLVSTGIVKNIDDTGIFSAQLSNMFDHKPVFLNFNGIKSNSKTKKKEAK
jgi:exonuclease III